MTGGPSQPFASISRQLLDSSVWETDLRVRVLWITILVTAAEPGRKGVIDMTVRALAGRACMSPEDTRYALDVLLAPDPNSRTTDHEGRRIELLDTGRNWGWRVLNWESHEQARLRQLGAVRTARWRNGHLQAAPLPAPPSVTAERHTPVTEHHGVTVGEKSDVDTDTDTDTDLTPPTPQGGLVETPRRTRRRTGPVPVGSRDPGAPAPDPDAVAEARRLYDERMNGPAVGAR